MSKAKKSGTLHEAPPAPQVYSTTIGRAKFPDFMQLSSSNKAVIGFDRYGQVLGAIVPIEAVKVLAGKGGDVGASVRAQIAKSANQLLAQMPSEHHSLEDFANGASMKAPRSVLELEEIEARRKRRRRKARV